MAVIIENINIPKSCMDCKFMYYYVGRYWCGANSIKDWVDDYKDSRHPDCSLREYERKTGKWILADNQLKEDVDNGNYRYICSNCSYADMHAKTQIVPYCWWCGAKMEKEEG